MLLSFLATLRYLLLVRLAKASVLFLAPAIQGLEHSLGVGNQLVDDLPLPVQCGSLAVTPSAQAHPVQFGDVSLDVTDHAKSPDLSWGCADCGAWVSPGGPPQVVKDIPASACHFQQGPFLLHDPLVELWLVLQLLLDKPPVVLSNLTFASVDCFGDGSKASPLASQSEHLLAAGSDFPVSALPAHQSALLARSPVRVSQRARATSQ